MANPRIDVTLMGAASAFPRPSTVQGVASVPQPVLVTSSGSTAYPKLASVFGESALDGPGAQSANTMRRYLGYGYNGIVYYESNSVPTAWTSDLAGLASTHGNVPINLQLTCKVHNDAGLDAVLAALPNAWRAGFMYNIIQEPEDNGLNWTTYKGYYTAAANRIRAWNAAHPTQAVSLPWIEVQEWTLDPLNTNSWGGTVNGPATMAALRPPTGDYAGVLWSFFEYGDMGKAPPNNDRIAAQLSRVLNQMNTTFAGKPWGIMASTFNLHPSPALTTTYTTAQRQAAAAWMLKSFTQLRAAGAVCYGWFDFWYASSSGTGAPGESRVDHIPELMTQLQALPD